MFRAGRRRNGRRGQAAAGHRPSYLFSGPEATPTTCCTRCWASRSLLTPWSVGRTGVSFYDHLGVVQDIDALYQHIKTLLD